MGVHKDQQVWRSGEETPPLDEEWKGGRGHGSGAEQRFWRMGLCEILRILKEFRGRWGGDRLSLVL